ncbi:pyridoxamine 5'-phosphate oxidase family protein [Amycolatopsis nigrescens]|uniref:pyridoxamine 5'-phosphate oxidase family protein n=1 Tax=Amycolatopsis nigrescens TaxID=381445 RepID=UPI000378E6CE|nr:pyridoxamine 5'-phosphate oxidase family protein [Amycolatopsis nigrescens]
MLDSYGLRMLDREQCLALLATARIGRVVFTHQGLPAVRPVKFVLCDDSICFGAPARSPLFAAAHDGVVAFEVDAFERDLTAGWFVTALGTANEARDCPALTTAALPWFPGEDDRCVLMPIELLSGYRVERMNAVTEPCRRST